MWWVSVIVGSPVVVDPELEAPERAGDGGEQQQEHGGGYAGGVPGGRGQTVEELALVLAEDGAQREVEPVEVGVQRSLGDRFSGGGVRRGAQRSGRGFVALPADGGVSHGGALAWRVGGRGRGADETPGRALRLTVSNGGDDGRRHLSRGDEA